MSSSKLGSNPLADRYRQVCGFAPKNQGGRMVIPAHHLAHDKVCRLIEKDDPEDPEPNTTTTAALKILGKECDSSIEDVHVRTKSVEGLFFALSHEWNAVAFQISTYSDFKLPHDRFAALLGMLRALGPVRYWHQEARGGPRYYRAGGDAIANRDSEEADQAEELIRTSILTLTRDDHDSDFSPDAALTQELERATRSFVSSWLDPKAMDEPILKHDPVRIDSALRLLNEMNRHDKEARLTLAGGIIMDALPYALLETVDAKVLRDHLLTEDTQRTLGFSTEIEDD